MEEEHPCFAIKPLFLEAVGNSNQYGKLENETKIRSCERQREVQGSYRHRKIARVVSFVWVND